VELIKVSKTEYIKIINEDISKHKFRAFVFSVGVLLLFLIALIFSEITIAFIYLSVFFVGFANYFELKYYKSSKYTVSK